MPGLNDIELPSALLAELYTAPLIIDEKINPPLIQEPPARTRNDEKKGVVLESKTLGGNLKKVMVAVFDRDHPVIADEDLKFLAEICKACSMSLEDIIIINRAKHHDSFDTLKNEFQPGNVLMFGEIQDGFSLPIRFPDFQVTSHSGVTYLSAPLLSQIKIDRSLKTSLWSALRKMFNL